MRRMANRHHWAFEVRFRARAYGWRGSALSGQRLKEAVREIRSVAKDRMRAAEGCVLLMERLWPALEHIDIGHTRWLRPSHTRRTNGLFSDAHDDGQSDRARPRAGPGRGTGGAEASGTPAPGADVEVRTVLALTTGRFVRICPTWSERLCRTAADPTRRNGMTRRNPPQLGSQWNRVW